MSHHECDYYEDEDYDRYMYQTNNGRPGNSNPNTPASLQRSRQDILRLQEETRHALQGALQSMGQHQSDNLSLLLALPLGMRSITFEHRNTDVEVVEKATIEKGVVVGKEITTTTKSRVQQRYHRFD